MFSNIIKQLATRLAVFVCDMFFPVECLACKSAGAYLCQTCLASVAWQDKQVCHFCKVPSSLGATCAQCRLSYALDGVLVMAQYRGLIKSAIRTYKYHFVRSLGSELGDLLARFFASQTWPHTEALVLALPLSRARTRWRGFNQSDLLASAVAHSSGLAIDLDHFIKTQHTIAQAKLSLDKRLELSDQVFAWQASSLSGQTILIIDDVISTGRTLSVAAEALKRAGAEQIWALVLARGD